MTRRSKSAIGNLRTAHLETAIEKKQGQIKGQDGGDSNRRERSRELHESRGGIRYFFLVLAIRGSDPSLPGLTGNKSSPTIRADTLSPTGFVSGKPD